MPDVRHLIVEQTIEDYFQFLTHHHKSINCFVNIYKTGCYSYQELVESQQLLLQHGVHRLLVHNGVLLCSLIHIEWLGKLGQNALNLFLNDSLCRCTFSSNIPRQQRQDSCADGVGLDNG